jgi:putative hemolysin
MWSKQRIILPLKQKDSYDALEAKKQLPPLVKGYINLGASIGNGVFADIPFNSLDVLIVLKIKEINERYLKRLL